METAIIVNLIVIVMTDEKKEEEEEEEEDLNVEGKFSIADESASCVAKFRENRCRDGGGRVFGKKTRCKIWEDYRIGTLSKINNIIYCKNDCLQSTT